MDPAHQSLFMKINDHLKYSGNEYSDEKWKEGVELLAGSGILVLAHHKNRGYMEGASDAIEFFFRAVEFVMGSCTDGAEP
jgi:hypothetical protein